MKICVVTCQYTDIWSGLGTYAKNLIDGLADLGHDVSVMSPGARPREAHPKVRLIDASTVSVAPTSSNWMVLGWQFSRALKQVLTTESFDVIHFCDARESLFFRHPGIPVVGSMHDYYFIECEKSPVYYFRFYSDWWKRWAFYNLSHVVEKVAMRRLDTVIANTDYVKRALEHRYGLSASRVVRIYLGLKIKRKAQEMRAGTEPLAGDPSVLFVGANFQRKGLPSLIAAIAKVRQQLPGIQLYVVGKDSKRSSMEALATTLHVDEHISFLGGLDNAEVLDLYARADIFAMPSLIEGFGLVFLEAMAAGTSVIGGNCGGTPELIIDGENGFVVNPDDPGALADKIALLASDSSLRERLRMQSRNSFDRFSIATMLAQTLAVYEAQTP